MSTKTLQDFPTIDKVIGNTPLVRLQRQQTHTNVLLVKLEGNNPAGSVKDRPVRAMVEAAERNGRIAPGDTLIEATSGNTGIALAMLAAARGYRLVIVMPANASRERRQVMGAYGAECILTAAQLGMEGAIDRANQMQRQGQGVILNQFQNPANPRSHYEATGPEIWRDTRGRITHLVASMGTTGTIMGTGRFLKQRNQELIVVGVQPEPGSKIPGIRKWPQEYLPTIYEPHRLDQIITVSKDEAEQTARRVARQEGLFCGTSSGGNIAAALKLCQEATEGLIVTIACDRGDRYLSTGLGASES